MGGYISILLLIAIAATCHGQNNKCKSYCVQLCRHNDWPNIPGGGMCCAGNGDRGDWNGRHPRDPVCRHGECDMRVDKYVPVLKSILRISGIIHFMSIKKMIHILHVLHLFFDVVAPSTNAAIWSTRVRIQCMQGEEELLEDPGHAQGLWMTAWRFAPPIRWVDVDICTKIQ